jgi:lysophospholipase L1-like esterase
MKPARVTLFVFSTVLFLGLIAAFFPGDGLNVGSLTLHFPTLEEIFNPDSEEVADISLITEAADSLNISDPATVEEDSLTGGFDIRLIEIDELKTRNLEFPDGDRSILFPFFRKLDSLALVRKQVRILHYGDSQIEGDRITHVLRRKFQSQFGGSGPGLVPVVDLYNSRAVNRTLTGPWQRFTLFGHGGKVPHSRYGAMASFSRFRPVVRDSVPTDSMLHTASVSFNGSGYPFALCRVFAGNASVPVAVEIAGSSGTLKTDSVGKTMKVISAQTGSSEVTITFTGYDSPDIYGVDLSSGGGVMVDNIAMRGSSGTVFTKMNAAQLQQMYDALNVELFILQFGGNVMPYIKTVQDCTNYGNWFYSQIALIRRLRPSACIIVIGPSDMSVKEKEHYVTYPLLENVRDALKQATFRAGGAYWDMYEAMGGRNSMPAWVETDPPLAAKDYIHFSPRGARLIGDMFYNALIWEYQLYIKNKKK